LAADRRAPDDGPSRLETMIEQGHALEAEGLPFPTEQIRSAYEEAVRSGKLPDANLVLKRGEALLTRVRTDWTWVRELLRRADELRGIAETIGVDVAHLDRRVGNPRQRLMKEPLSMGSLEKAAASASLALAVLNDAIPKFVVQEAQQLGVSLRRARDRGEDVREVSRIFSRLLQALQDQNIPTAAQRLVEARRAVVRIPRAPALPAMSAQEEEAEILLEARNLARRLQRIKSKAQNAQSAARLMAQVRAAISEERRTYGTPEEEIEVLWAEVDRLSRERKRAATGTTLGSPPTPGEGDLDDGAATSSPAETAPVGNGNGKPSERAPPTDVSPSYYVPYVPPEASAADAEADPEAVALANRNRTRPRPRA
jgi:type II secretory pathway pseudopilin PulG